MSALPKPVLRGHIQKRGLKGIIGGIIFAAVNGTLYHYIVAVPRQKAYEDFVRNYDEEAHYKNMVKYGYLQSAKKKE